MGTFDYSYASITPDDVRRLRLAEYHAMISAEIMAALENDDLTQIARTEQIKVIVTQPSPEAFDLDYALAARDGAKARHDTPVVKLWQQEINRLKFDLAQRNDQRRTAYNDGQSGHYHD